MLINLHACTVGEEILDAVPNGVVVSEVVIRELSHQTSRNNGEYEFIQGLVSRGKLEPVPLDGKGFEIFQALISGTASIGDGEAATIAIAASQRFVPVIDDGKGRAQAESTIKKAQPAWSLDLFLHPRVQAELAGGKYVDAIHLALREGRMRIDEKRCNAVVNLIGVERAKLCVSLPGYKQLLRGWEQKKC
ncbi:hypothetical protein [Elongatibacter sediminis]|uniref:PIN domain-containing protein n=1 Tax=Elongatibacter sediminis TaxID=3119006 RepID=A0AAW9RD13_9GAMM